ncbi:MAG: hypothetical protein ACP5OP_09295, partial [Leptospirillia bacterium]
FATSSSRSNQKTENVTSNRHSMPEEKIASRPTRKLDYGKKSDTFLSIIPYIAFVAAIYEVSIQRDSFNITVPIKQGLASTVFQILLNYLTAFAILFFAFILLSILFTLATREPKGR